MAWKSSAVWMFGGLAATLGFVAVGRLRALPFARDLLRGKAGRAHLPQSVPSLHPRPLGDEELQAEDAARADALHDLRLAEHIDHDPDVGPSLVGDGYDDEITIASEGEIEDEIEIELSDEVGEPLDKLEPPEMVHYSEHATAHEEQYDSMDAESMGEEWLRRATESDAPETQNVLDTLEGTQSVAEADTFDEDTLDLDFPDDAEDDAAEELPVGHFERDGSAELHTRHRRGETEGSAGLSPTIEELDRRGVGIGVSHQTKPR